MSVQYLLLAVNMASIYWVGYSSFPGRYIHIVYRKKDKNDTENRIEQKGKVFLTLWLFILLFFFPYLLGGKGKGKKNNQSRCQ